MICASRRLTIRKNPSAIPVDIRFYAPQKTAEGNWTCDYEIDWPEGLRRFRGSGADSLQALVIAMQMVAAELYASTHHKRGDLCWYEPQSGFGIPISPNCRDLLTQNDARAI